MGRTESEFRQQYQFIFCYYEHKHTEINDSRVYLKGLCVLKHIVADAGGHFTCLISEHFQLSYLHSIKTSRGPAIQMHTGHRRGAKAFSNS